MTRCLTSVEFASYLSGDPMRADHVTSCARCSSIAVTLAPVGTADIDLNAAVDEIARRRGSASAAVAVLEAAFPSRWLPIIECDERFHTPEAIRKLLARATDTYGATPRRSLLLAQAALRCCDLAHAAPDLHFDSLKETSKYLLLAADDIAEALRTLDAAEALVPSSSDPTYFASILAFARASIYGHSTCARWSVAIDLLNACEPILHIRDTGRWRAARHLRAAILLRSSEYAAACALYRELLAAEQLEPARAALSKDLGWCYVKTGQPEAALLLLAVAISSYAHNDNRIDMARAMWAKGDALSALGQHVEAVATLKNVSRTFRNAGLYDDELGAELSVVRALRSCDSLVDVTERLTAAFQLACALDTAQPLRSGARRAALWSELQSSHERNRLSFALLDHAGEYLRTIGRGDEAAFMTLQ